MIKLAQTLQLPGTSVSGPIPAGRGLDSPAAIVNQAIPIIFFFAGFILLVMLIIAGYQYITSRGDPKALSQASGRLTFAIVGFLVVFGSYWLLALLNTLAGGFLTILP